MNLLQRAILHFERNRRFDWMPDKLYLKFMFFGNMGKFLNFKKVHTMNEKLQWLKLYDRDPLYTMMVDKYRVREYIAQLLGEEFLIPLVGVWEDSEDIDFDALPQQFVLKCNHNSGLGMCICRDKSQLDTDKVKRDLKKGLEQNYYLSGREWPYKDVKRCVIGEKFMTDSAESTEFTDYKFYCFNGYVDCVLAAYERSTGDPKFYFFDRNWQLKRYNQRGMAAPENFTMPKPKNMDRMFEIAEIISKDVGCPFLRVDLYNVEGHIYFGELTFFPSSGFESNRLPEMDRYFGDLINLKIRKQE